MAPKRISYKVLSSPRIPNNFLKKTYEYGDRIPLNILEISRWFRAIKQKARCWQDESTHPPRFISSSKFLAASIAISSGTLGSAPLLPLISAWDTEQASPHKNVPPIVSATRVKPNAGELPAFSRFWWSVVMYTSGKNLSRTPLAVSTRRLQTAGATRMAYAMPRMRLILPGSVRFIGSNFILVGHVNLTWPPPCGLAPRLAIVNSRPSSEPMNRLTIGMDEYFK